tara:strand:+ start:459 stop:689 length:231 start_codon:yes stop_codon:yes gene_type:complete
METVVASKAIRDDRNHHPAKHPIAKNTATGTDAANDATYGSSDISKRGADSSNINEAVIANVRREIPVPIQTVWIQ